MQLRNLGAALALLLGLLVANPARVLAEEPFGMEGGEPDRELSGTGTGAAAVASPSEAEIEAQAIAEIARILAKPEVACGDSLEAREGKTQMVFDLFKIRLPITGPIPAQTVEEGRPRIATVVAGMKALNPDSLHCLASWANEVIAMMPTDPPNAEAKAVLESVRAVFEVVVVEVERAAAPLP